MNAADLGLSAAGGLGLSFLATYLFSLGRTPKLLDDDRREEITTRDATIQNLEEKMGQLKEASREQSAPVGARPSTYEQEHLRLTEEKLNTFSVGERSLIKHILHHGKTYERELPRLSKELRMLLGDEVVNATRTGIVTGLLKGGFERGVGSGRYWEINPEFRAALEKLLSV